MQMEMKWIEGWENRVVRRDSICPGFSETFPVLWVLKSRLSVSHKIRFGTPKFPFFTSHKSKIFFDTPYEHFDFSEVEDNVYRSRTAFNRPVRNGRGRVYFVCIGDYKVCTETAKVEGQMYTYKSVRELSLRV